MSGEALRNSPERFILRGKVLTRIVTKRDGSARQSSITLPPATTLEPGVDLAATFDQYYLRTANKPLGSKSRTTINVADLFAGSGLMSLGVAEACRALDLRFRAALMAELSETARKTYVKNLEPGIVVNNVLDVLDGRIGAKLTGNEKKLRRQLGRLQLLIAGPPCQGHSSLNNHTRRTDPRNRLYERIARMAELTIPDHVIVENVPEVLNDSFGVVDRTKRVLERLGYALDDAVLNLETLGIPQVRRRHFLVASRTRQVDLKEMVASFSVTERPVSWAIGDLTDQNGTAFDSHSTPNSVTRARIDYLFRHKLHDLPDRYRPPCHKLQPHSYKSVYGRMYWNRPAQTITSGFTCMGQGRYVHPRRKRTLSPHEAARIQFIPDFFHFDTQKRTELCEMVANAVPPKATYVISLSLLR